MMTVILGTEWAEKYQHSLPIYNIAGDMDPVGEYGEGVYAVSNWLLLPWNTGKNKTIFRISS